MFTSVLLVHQHNHQQQTDRSHPPYRPNDDTDHSSHNQQPTMTTTITTITTDIYAPSASKQHTKKTQQQQQTTTDLVMQDGVAVAEGAPLHILPGEADVVTLQQQSPERQRLRRAPVNPLAVHDRLTADSTVQHSRSTPSQDKTGTEGTIQGIWS